MEIDFSHITMRIYCRNYNQKNRTDSEKVYNKKQKYWKKKAFEALWISFYDNFGVCKNNGTMADPQGTCIIVQ